MQAVIVQSAFKLKNADEVEHTSGLIIGLECNAVFWASVYPV